MNREDFLRAREEILAGRSRDSIGTYKEKSVHAVLKRAYEPHAGNQEVTVGGYVADILGEEGIIEIQSRDLWKLKPKLTAFLEFCPVTVVYPIALTEWILRTDPDTGETTRRRSPRKASPFDALEELSPIRRLTANPRFRLRLCLLSVERQDVGRAGERHKRHLDRFPLDFLGEIPLECPADYLSLLPGGLPEAFTAAELGKAAGRPAARARPALLTLRELGLAEPVGKRGRETLYRLAGLQERGELQCSGF